MKPQHPASAIERAGVDVQYQAFRGADLKEALGQVKATLGPNAVIDTTRQVSNGHAGGLGRSYVEVTAAAPAGIEWPFGSSAPARPARERAATAAAARRSGRGGAFSLLGQASTDVERELTSLRAMVEELNATLPPKERALALLHAAGIEGSLAREIANGAARPAKKGREVLRKWLLDRTRERIGVLPDLLSEPGPTVIACVGPTGVGKTTTLAKLAARARLDLGRSVSVLSLDTFRVGAVETWQRYSTLMGIPLHVAHEVTGFQRAVRECRSDVLLIDTAGRSALSSNSLLGEGLRGMSSHRVNVLLVVPAWLRASDAERVVSMYEDPTPNAIVVSKLDETRKIGGALHAALPFALPIAYLCDGPRVPEDIQDASVDSVMNALFASEVG